MRRSFPIGLAGLLLAALPLRAVTPEAAYLQPANGRDGLVLQVERNAASVRHPDGRVDRARLRTDERLLSFTELEDGWLASGIRVLDDGADLLLVARGAAGTRRLPVPPPSVDGPLLRTRPVPLTSAGRLVGLAWLEGVPGDPLTVWTARFGAEGWEARELVARPGRGSQTGLVGAVLPDGRRLLVWSRFDGTDDELVWSTSDAAGWTAPRPVHADNDTPDVAPALFADGEVVLLAWSRLQDGEYRVLTSAWRGAGFGPARNAGSAGTVFPQFAGLDGDPYLSMRQARTGGWELLDLDRDGRALRRLEIAGDERSAGRPALTATSGTVARILRPGSAAPRDVVWEVLP